MDRARLLETDQLDNLGSDKDYILVDMCSAEQYAKAHIPGAIYLEYADIVRKEGKTMGLLPTEHDLSQLFAAHGITPDKHIIAYDAEGGGKATRLLWTLEAAGYDRLSLLNGGWDAWLGENRSVDNKTVAPRPAALRISFHRQHVIADRAYIQSNLNNANLRLLDARTAAEYAGTDVRAARGGHIPGAHNINWLDLMDNSNFRRLKPEAQLRKMLEDADILPKNEVVSYCQTHHRSALTYYMLKVLGYDRARGYPGSWSDWGNCADTPID